MKRIAFLAIALLLVFSASAQNNITVSSKGTINSSVWKGGETASLSISRIPKTVDEFKSLQQKIGITPEGAVMLQLVAFEMYHQDKKTGELCIRLNNVDINIPSVMRRIPEVYRKGDSYSRPYLVATYFDGATPENGYNPNTPYTIKVRTHARRSYERSQSMKGYVLYLEVLSSGYQSSPWRGCEVIKQKGSEYFKVSNCPSMYVQCMEIPFDSSRDYEGVK